VPSSTTCTYTSHNTPVSAANMTLMWSQHRVAGSTRVLILFLLFLSAFSLLSLTSCMVVFIFFDFELWLDI